MCGAIFQASIDSLNLHERPTRGGHAGRCARGALLSWVPAYEALIATMERHREGAAEGEMAHGVCPKGRAYYAARLGQFPPPPISPQASPTSSGGLANVARIHGEMREIMDEVGF